MLRCPNCNKEFTEDNAFCDTCGIPLVAVEEPIFPHPNENEDGGLPLEEPVAPPKKKRRGLKIFGISAAVISVLLVAAIVVNVFYPSLFGSLFNRTNPYVFYFKNKELFFSKTTKTEPFQFTDDLVKSGSFGEYTESDLTRRVEELTQISHDGKYLFFIDGVDAQTFLSYESGADLYYREMNKPKQDPVKISSDVTEYQLSKDGNLVTFSTHSKSTAAPLYQYNLKEEQKEKIGDDVSDYGVSEEGTTVAYLEKGELFFWKNGKKNKVTNKVVSLEGYSKDLKVLYFQKEGNELYVVNDGESHKKIADKFTGGYSCTVNGELYYTKETPLEKPEDALSYYQLVEDDLLASDKTMKAPVKPIANYQTVEQYNQYQKKLQAYNTALAEYNAMIKRNDLRSNLLEQKLTYSALCYYNGSRETVLTYTVNDIEVMRSSSSCLVYSQHNYDAPQKTKMSHLQTQADAIETLNLALENSATVMLASNGIGSVIDCKSPKKFDITDDMKTLYFIADYNTEKGMGNLYQATISGNQVSKPTLYDSEVSLFSAIDTHVSYAKNFDKESSDFDLYWDKALVDSDVRRVLQYHKNSQALYYVTDFDNEDQTGTLKIYQDKKSEKIADDVYQCTLIDNGDLAYLADYNKEKSRGDLYIYNGKKSEKADTDVTVILQITDPYADQE